MMGRCCYFKYAYSLITNSFHFHFFFNSHSLANSYASSSSFAQRSVADVDRRLDANAISRKLLALNTRSNVSVTVDNSTHQIESASQGQSLTTTYLLNKLDIKRNLKMNKNAVLNDENCKTLSNKFQRLKEMSELIAKSHLSSLYHSSDENPSPADKILLMKLMDEFDENSSSESTTEPAPIATKANSDVNGSRDRDSIITPSLLDKVDEELSKVSITERSNKYEVMKVSSPIQILPTSSEVSDTIAKQFTTTKTVPHRLSARNFSASMRGRDVVSKAVAGAANKQDWAYHHGKIVPAAKKVEKMESADIVKEYCLKNFINPLSIFFY